MMKSILVCAMALAVTAMGVDMKGMDAPKKHEIPPKLVVKGDMMELTIPKDFRDVTVRVVTHSLADAPREQSFIVWEGKGQKTITVPRFDGPHDRMYKTWLILDLDNHPMTKPFHVVKVEAKHKGYEKPLFRPKEIKGVSCVVDMQDATDLGAKHIHTNLSLGHFWTTDPKNAIMHKFDGKTYMLNKQNIEGFDRQLQEFYRRGISVFVVFTNTYSENPILSHPGTKKVAHMTLAGFNTATPEGIDYYAAVCDFLAKRYTRDDAKYGQMSALIVGNEVQMHGIWYNIGEMPVDKFAVEYAKAVRVAQLAAWNNNPDLRVYVSMEHHWTHGDPKSGRMVPGRLFLEHFNHVVKEGGDIPWNLAHHPYPENLFNPRFWNDRTAKPNFDTPRITFRNIEQLVKFFKQDEWRYHGKMRDIALTEQGVNYEDNKPDAELAQAAAYAYAYKKIKALPEISAFILHRHVDHAQEGGLHLGLRFNKEGTIASAGKKRMVWDVFKAAGRPDEDKAFAFALKFIGIKNWKDKMKEPEEPKSIFAFDKKDLVYDFRDNMSEAIANRNSLDTRQNEVIRAAGWLVKTIFQHPPRDPKGWSELSYKVKLPEVKRKKLILAWESMVGNDASSGVAFRVMVNGKDVWNAVCKPKQAPVAGEIDLTLFAGKEVIVTFGTNGHGDIAGDWANWIQPTIYKR
ncbi:MAG: hypothetical protein J6T06_06535 [Victivallales bacterium]|nr:hypothetical protein [Victivallales bacterium]